MVGRNHLLTDFYSKAVKSSARLQHYGRDHESPLKISRRILYRRNSVILFPWIKKVFGTNLGLAAISLQQCNRRQPNAPKLNLRWFRSVKLGLSHHAYFQEISKIVTKLVDGAITLNYAACRSTLPYTSVVPPAPKIHSPLYIQTSQVFEVGTFQGSGGISDTAD